MIINQHEEMGFIKSRCVGVVDISHRIKSLVDINNKIKSISELKAWWRDKAKGSQLEEDSQQFQHWIKQESRYLKMKKELLER